MSLMGTALGRGLSAAGGSVAEIANKYIDQNLALARAQAIADIQRASTVAQAGQLDDLANDPSRRARRREGDVADVRATGTAKNEVDLAGKRAVATDPALQQAEIDRIGKVGEATAAADRKATVAAGSDPTYLSAARKLAQAKHFESAGSLAQAALAKLQAEGAKLDLDKKRQVMTLQNQLAEARTSGNEAAVQRIQRQISDLAFAGKDTAAAYKAYTAAQNKLLDLEVKLANSAGDPAIAAGIKREIDATKAEQTAFARDLGVNIPERAETPVEAPPAAIDALRKNPQRAAEFDAKFGKGAAAKVLSDGGADVPLVERASKRTGGILKEVGKFMEEAGLKPGQGATADY